MSSFEWALTEIKAGKEVARKGWNGKGQSLRAHWPDNKSKVTQPYIAIKTVDGNIIPWTASQADIFADDWEHALPAPSPKAPNP